MRVFDLTKEFKACLSLASLMALAGCAQSAQDHAAQPNTPPAAQIATQSEAPVLQTG